MDMIQVKNIELYYDTENGKRKVLDNIDFENEKGFTAITGPCGSGKTSLIQIMGGLKRPTNGKVVVNGTDLNDFDDEGLAIFRRRNIGFIFRQYNLIPVLNIFENISLPIELDGRSVDREYIYQIAKLLKIEDKLTSYPRALSSGERQKVSIARALSTKPAVVLADEPTSNLDSKASTEVIGLLKMACREFNQNMIIATHDMTIAEMADQIIYMNNGKLENIEKRKVKYVKQ